MRDFGICGYHALFIIDGKLRNPEDDTDRRFCYDYNG
jgi:hypothetical protein